MGGERVPPPSTDAIFILFGLVAVLGLTPVIAVVALIVAVAK